MRADVRNHLLSLRRAAAVVCLLAALIAHGVASEAVAQPAATDQYVEEEPTGPGTGLDTGAPASPPPPPAPVAEPAPTPEPVQPEQGTPTERKRPAEVATPSIPVRPPTPAALPVAEDGGGSGTLWLGGYGVTPFVFCIAALLATCLLWRLGTAGAARLRAG